MSKSVISTFLLAAVMLAYASGFAQANSVRAIDKTDAQASPEPSRSQNRSVVHRPKVGVALSGGGALGLAHIGVIRYFEENRIPIDLIAGTSMGGLVGGFYAAGMDSQGMTKIAEQADWDLLLNPTPRFQNQPVVEKQAWNQTFGNFTLRLGRRFSLPQGLNPGEALALLLSRNTVGYGTVTDFDELPTPFRCVATDLISADAVVLRRGSLTKAMRATMALPAVFTPVKWEDKLLVDGGLVQNLPVEAVIDMGADKTIAVVLQGGRPEQQYFKSLASILLRSISVAIEQNERRSAALADLVIPVDTRQFTATDYARARDLIRAGYEAAKAKAQDLQQFELSPEEWSSYISLREERSRRAPRKGHLAKVTAPDPAFQRNAEVELARKLGSGPVREDELEDTLSGIVAATGVPGASYQWHQQKNGYAVEFLQRPGESILVRPSFLFGISSGEPSRAALRLSLSRIGANAYKSRTVASATIGYDPGMRMEYYHPIDGTGYFVAPGMFIERTHINSYTGATRNDETRDRFGISFYSGIGTWRFAQLRLGLRTGYDSYSKPVTTDGVLATSHGFANPEIAWTYNTQDSAGLPYRGTRMDGSAGYSFRNTSFPYFRTDLTTVGALSNRISVIGTGQVATSFGKKLNFYEQFTAGGAGQLSAFRYQEFHANSMVIAGGGLLFHGPPVRRLSVHPGLAVLYEAGRFDLGSRGWQTHQSATTGVFFPTPIGAAGLGLSFDENGKARFRLSLGAIGRR